MFSRILVVALVVLAGCGGRAPSRRAPIPPPAAPAPAPVPLPPAAEKPRVEAPPAPSAPKPELPEPPKMLAGSEGFEAGVFRGKGGEELQYRLFRPSTVDNGEKYPLVVFLHGASGKGSDNRSQLTESRRLGAYFWTGHGAYVLAPQVDSRRHDNWVRQWRLIEGGKAEPLELTVELLSKLAEEFPIDERRLYLTGYSMGGFGTWIGISRHPELFAAAIPICGGGDPTDVGDARAEVWAFHGAADRVVPVRRSREMVKALEAAGRKPRYTEYPGVGHAVWERVYREPGLAEWLFGQRR